MRRCRPARTGMPAPLSPYGASKWAGEAYVKTWSLSSGIPHAVCRLGNVYGPRQNPHGEAGVVAIFSHHLLHRAAPQALRPRQADARLRVRRRRRRARCSPRRAESGTYNIATGVETDVATIWRELQRGERAGSDLEPRARRPAPGRAAAQLPGHRPAPQRELGWQRRGADRGGPAAHLRRARWRSSSRARQ